MSWQPTTDPDCPIEGAEHPVETLIVPRVGDIGGFEVRRALPSKQRKMVGPFIFLDQMGPNAFPSGEGLDVRPHPHIGLATLTYLFDGELMHRDSLGIEQAIKPGEVNLMTAGRGIAHSERTAEELRPTGPRLYGMQSWIALPHAKEETDPGFSHHLQSDLPVITDTGTEVRLVVGSLYGETSAVPTYSESFYADAILEAGTRLPLPADHEERAAYVAEGAIDVAGDRFEAGRLLVFRPGDEITLTAAVPSRLLLLGGAAMDGPRYLWWNFVSSSRERIEQAKADWKAGRFPEVPGDDEFIPLPDR